MRSLKSESPISPSSPVSRNVSKQATSGPSLSPWRIWLMASRLPTLPAAVVPVVVGTAVAVSDGHFRFWALVAALVAALLIQIGTNLANDYFDFKKGADTEKRLGPTRVTQAGLLPPQAVFRGMLVMFALAVLAGLYLIYLGGWPILVVGLVSIAAGIAYTGGPWPLAYHGLGDVFVFVFFGVVAVTGTYYVHAETLNASSLIASVPVGLLATAILVVNNLRDIDTDRAAGKRTLAVRLGPRLTRIQYAACLIGAYIVPIVLWRLEHLGAGFWLVGLTLPLSIPLLYEVMDGASGRALNPVLGRTGRLHLLYGLLFSVSFLW